MDTVKIGSNANSGSPLLVKRSFLILVTFVILNILLVIDTSIIGISTYTGGIYPFESYTTLFSLIYAVYVAANILIIRLVKNQLHSASSSKGKLFNSFFTGITTTQYVILVMILILLIQIFSNRTFPLWIFKSASYNSYILGSLLLGILSYKLLSWYRKNNSIILILYFLAVSMICVNSIVMLSSLELQLSNKPDNIFYSRTLAGSYSPGSGIYKLLQEYSLIISFSLMWVATAFVMKSYSSLRGLVRYWAIMLISLIYFTGQLQSTFFGIDMSKMNAELGDVGYTVFIGSSKPIAGILFGLVFWIISRRIEKKTTKEYLLITGFGMMLLFASNQPSGLSLTPLPPFGILTAASFGLSSYLMFTGLYSSSVSVSHDLSLRKQARTYANQLILLDKIGTPEMKQHVESLVLRAMKDLKKKANDLADDSGVSSSLDEENFKDYLQMVLEEVRKSKS